MLSLLLGLGFILLGVLPQGYISLYLLKTEDRRGLLD